MKIPTVEKCCCGCKLRTGSAIIGILFFLSCLSQTVSLSVQANNAVANGDEDNRVAYIVGAVLSAVMLGSTVVLLLGVHKENEGLLRPWLLLFGVLICLAELALVVVAVVAFVVGVPGVGAVLLVAALVYFLIYGYCLVVVYSYYLSLTVDPPAYQGKA